MTGQEVGLITLRLIGIAMQYMSAIISKTLTSILELFFHAWRKHEDDMLSTSNEEMRS